MGKTIARLPGPPAGPDAVDALVEQLLAEEDKNLPHTRRALDEGPGQLWQVVQEVMAGKQVRFTRSDTILAELELSGAILPQGGVCAIRNPLYRRAIAAWTSPASPAAPSQAAAAPVPPVASPRIKILFLAANPSDTARLRLGEEAAAIDQALRLAAYRDAFDLEQAHAVRAGDLPGLLLRHQPHIVHFSGHGAESGEILFQDEQGRAQPAPVQALADAFRLLKDNIRCVLLNACFSLAQALAIAQHIDCVVGMTAAIPDREARAFAADFYSALAYGRSVQTAFDLGRNRISLAGVPDEAMPQLLALAADPAAVTFVG